MFAKSRFFKKYANWSTILLVLSAVLVCMWLMSWGKRGGSNIETFIQREKFVSKVGIDAFDSFYADIYDELLFSEIKDQFEVEQIVNKTSPTEESIVLDVGSGTGHQCGRLAKKGMRVAGIDLSEFMVAKAKQNYPEVDFKAGNVLDSIVFPPQSFTHVLCLYFTIYQVEDKKKLLQNIYGWLMPGGHFVMHLVDRYKFDPIVPAASSLLMVSPQKYAKERITSSQVAFDSMDYKAEFAEEFGKDKAEFIETFTDKESGNVRQNRHVLHIPTQKAIIDMAKECGFILTAQIEMGPAGYDNQYIYVMQKPQ